MHLKFVARAIATNLKLSLALKAAFLITLFLTVLKQVLFLVSWRFFFEKYKMVQGWDFKEMLLMYGIVCFAIGFVEAFFYGLKDLPKLIETSQLDTFLLQPKNVILNVALSKGDVSAFGEMVTGILLIGYSGYFLKAFPLILLVLILGIVFMFSLFLYLGCIAFFMKESDAFIRELNLNAIIVATQPNAAYRGVFKMLTFTVLPVAFLSYLPIEYFRTGLKMYLLWSTVGTLAFFTVASWVFYLGLKRYESGNMIAFRH